METLNYKAGGNVINVKLVEVSM